VLQGEEQTVTTSMVKYFSTTDVGEGYRKYEQWLNDLCANGSHFQHIYQECVIPSPSWMLLKEDAKRHGLFNSLNHPEDYDLCFRLYESGFKVKTVNKVLHLWRDHPSRTSRISSDYDIRKFGLFKLRWFLKLEMEKTDELAIWGCGRKGKELARYLMDGKIQFHWVSGNQLRTGHKIYGQIVQSVDMLQDKKNFKVVVAVSSPADKTEVSDFLKKLNFIPGRNIFFFY
jgi:hypothetical protein